MSEPLYWDHSRSHHRNTWLWCMAWTNKIDTQLVYDFHTIIFVPTCCLLKGEIPNRVCKVLQCICWERHKLCWAKKVYDTTKVVCKIQTSRRIMTATLHLLPEACISTCIRIYVLLLHASECKLLHHHWMRLLLHLKESRNSSHFNVAAAITPQTSQVSHGWGL